MKKLGVVIDPSKIDYIKESSDDEADTAEIAVCPACGYPLSDDTICLCINCGTEPLEPTDR